MAATAQNAIAVIGIDIGKNSFHVIGLDGRGAIVLRQKWSRGQVETRFANMSPCLIGMEACVGAHPLSRKLKTLGHDARLMPARYVRPYSKGQKNDFRDAEAIAEAVQRPTMKFVVTSKRGNRYLRVLFVQAAWVVLVKVKPTRWQGRTIHLGHTRTTSLAVVCPLPSDTDMVRETSCAVLLCLGICPCRQPHREDRAFARLARHRDVRRRLGITHHSRAGGEQNPHVSLHQFGREWLVLVGSPLGGSSDYADVVALNVPPWDRRPSEKAVTREGRAEALPVYKNPTSGSFGCDCARAASGQPQPPPPPSNAINSRRPMVKAVTLSPKPEGCGPTIAQSKGLPRAPRYRRVFRHRLPASCLMARSSPARRRCHRDGERQS